MSKPKYKSGPRKTHQHASRYKDKKDESRMFESDDDLPSDFRNSSKYEIRLLSGLGKGIVKYHHPTRYKEKDERRVFESDVSKLKSGLQMISTAHKKHFPHSNLNKHKDKDNRGERHMHDNKNRKHFSPHEEQHSFKHKRQNLRENEKQNGSSAGKKYQHNIFKEGRQNNGLKKDNRSTQRFYQADGKRHENSRNQVCPNENDSRGEENGKNQAQATPNSKVRNKVNVTPIERKPMDLNALRTLTSNDDFADVYQGAVDPQSGFQQLLELEKMDPDTFSLVVTVLGQACRSSTKDKNIYKLMYSVVCNKNFSYQVIQYLVSLNENSSQSTIQSFHWLLSFFISLQQAMPGNSNACLSILLPSIKNCVQQLACLEELEELRILDTVVILEEENEHFNMVCKDPQEKTQRIFEEKKHALEPEENFRLISIFPTKEDLCKNEVPFLRPNLTLGKYIDAEHYLDVQFRLLREDFIRPFREGIGNFKALNNTTLTTISELHIFRNVHILYPKCTPYGIMHTIQFDTTNFKRTNWEAQKRWLMGGSLVCFSKDNFETMLFAEVSYRDSLNLTKGLLDVKFKEIDDNLLRYRPFETFVMLETNAYFEAYRHNLLKLQKLNNYNMPFQQYIVHISNEVKPPSYLVDNPDVKYDLRPLMIPFPDKKMSALVLEEEDSYVYGEFPEEMNHGKGVDMLDSSSWPTPDDLSLDIHQFNAIKNTLTKEFVVIQGPPGTGKTYIGLRIMQILLANRHAWHETDPAPILIVCYTNHALDQFLEDVLLFTHRLVRVGGRCSSEELEGYKLAELRRTRRENKQSVGSMREMMALVNTLQMTKQEIDTLEMLIAIAGQEIISELKLQPYMEHSLWESLRKHSTFAQRVDTVEDDGFLIMDWLGARLQGPEAIQWLHDQPEFKQILKISKRIDAGMSDNEDNSAKQEERKEDEEANSQEKKNKLKGDIFAADDAEDFYLSRHVDEDDKQFLEQETYDCIREELVNIKDFGYENVIGGSKTRQLYLDTELRKTKILSSEEIGHLPQSIWSLPLNMRWCLYRTWVARFVLGQMEKMVILIQKYKMQLKKMAKLRLEEDLAILRNSLVVGMTTTGAAKYQDLISALRPKIVIAEEAAEVLEAHLVTSLCTETQHLILIGDHQQLRPNPAVYELALKYKLDVSLFERLVKNNFPCEKLITQHRMRPTICKLLVPHIYEKLLCHPSVKNRDDISGIEKSVYFISHDHYEGREEGSSSLVNEHEAHFLIALCRYLLFQNYKPSEITILATYSMQTNLLQSIAKQQSNENLPLSEVLITSVDSYQGNQNEIILISFVRSNDYGKIGFLSTENRVCVALSRARKGLYCIGNFPLLEKVSPLWTKIVKYLNDKGLIGPELKLVCQNHPTDFAYVRSAPDFQKVPEGGCSRQCSHVYKPCKHQCKMWCHPYDKEHKVLLCTERCNKKSKTCEHRPSHRCEKMCGNCCLNESCGMCTTKVYKELACFHEVRVPCGADPKKYLCPMPCLREMACGHTCKNNCGEECVVLCEEKVDVPAPCCHLVNVKCHEKDMAKKRLEKCKEKCGKVLNCGHICDGDCGSCFQGRFHKKCERHCDRQLVCGHFCPKKCFVSCPPCQDKCENQCDHGECNLQCSFPCKRCTMSCCVECIHQKCNLLCWEKCSIQPCSKPCTRTLRCNHTCAGFCGDPCPHVCYKCYHARKNEESDARYILLEQCDHIITEEQLTKALKSNMENILKPPCCPECKTPIKSNRRCSSILKLYGFISEQIKEQLICIANERRKQQEEVKCLAQKLLPEMDHNVQIRVDRVNQLLVMDDRQGVNKVIILKNVLILLEIVNNCSLNFESMKSFMEKEKLDSVTFCSIANRVRDGILNFVGAMLDEKHCSIQQLLDVCHEVLRLLSLCTLCKELTKIDCWRSIDTVLVTRIQEVLRVLSMYLPFSKEFVETDVDPVVVELQKLHSVPYNSLLDHIFGRILRPVNMSVGHWRLCSKGHVYGDSLQPIALGDNCSHCVNLEV